MVIRHTIILPHRYEWNPATWAKENCPSYLSATANLMYGKNLPESTIEYHFKDEKDAAWFALRWL
jgi:hypothetical protein